MLWTAVSVGHKLVGTFNLVKLFEMPGQIDLLFVTEVHCNKFGNPTLCIYRNEIRVSAKQMHLHLKPCP